MRRRFKPKTSSYKMLRDNSRNSNAITSQQNSFPPCCTAFWDCTDLNYETDGYITDKVSGIRILEGATWPWVASPEPGNAANIANFDAAFLTYGYDRQYFGNKDFLAVQVAQAKLNVYQTLTPEQQALSAGAFAFYVTQLSTWSFRMHPHYAVWQDDTTGHRIATDFYLPLKYRNENQIYVTGGGRRGNEIVHFCETANDNETVKETVSVDVYSQLTSAEKTNWDNARFDTPRYGHSVFGADDGETAGNTEGPSPIYGIAIFVFKNGMPDDVPQALNWMKTEWVKGNKVIYPPWVTLE